jgi:signal peptidase I
LGTIAEKRHDGIWDTVKLVLQALAIALVFKTFFFQPFSIPTGSLIPTVLIGDYLWVSKYSYGYSRHSFPFSAAPIEGRIIGAEPKLGEIAVFKLPKDNATDYVKRVIGLPGDRIQVIRGVLHINGAAVKEERIGEEFSENSRGQRIRAIAYWETLPNGVRHKIHKQNDGRGFQNNTEIYAVPPGHFFMMGDNRDDSTDSRFLSDVGYVPYVNFVGRAEMVFFSLESWASVWQIWNWPWALRFDRMFTRIQ